MSASSQPTPMDEDSDCSATSALQVSALAAAGAWAHATAPSACGGNMAELPADCVLQVLHHLDRGSLVACAQACRRWRELCKSVSLWHRLFLTDFCRAGHRSRLSSNDLGGSAVPYGAHSQQAKWEDAQRLLGQEGATTDWRMLYQRRCEVERAWTSGDSSGRVLTGHSDFIRCAQLEGSTLVTASGSISHKDCTIRVWDLDTGTLRQLLRGHMGPIWCMLYDPTSGRIASGSDDYTVRYWDAQTGNCVSLQDPDSAVRCIHLDPVGRQLVAGTEFGRLMLWDTDMLDELLTAGLERVRREFERIRPSDHGASCRQSHMSARRVVVDGSNNVQALDSTEEGKAISAIQVQSGLCASTSVEPLSRVQLWDVSAAAQGSRPGGWRLLRSIGDGDMMFVNSMSFEKSLGVLVGGCGDRNMRVWDLETGACTHLLRGHTDQISAHQFDATTLVSAAFNGVIRVWDLRSNKCIHALEHGAAVHAFQWDGGWRLASGTWDGRTMLWDMKSGRKVKEWRSHCEERVWAIAMDDYHIVSAGLDSNVCVRSFLPEDLRFGLWAPEQGAG